jgi:hypothetical protein
MKIIRSHPEIALRWRAWRQAREMERGRMIKIRAEDRAERKAERDRRRAGRPDRHPAGPVPGSLRVPRVAALVAISAIVAAASLTSFAESYRALFEWAHEHGLSGTWAAAWPLMVDSFIAVGELALFVALTDRWLLRHRLFPWAVILAGLSVSVAGNIGHVHGHLLSDRGTAAVPPLAAAASLAVGLGVLKRVVGRHAQPPARGVPDTVPSTVLDAARVSLAATAAAGNPWSVNQLAQQFSLTRATATRLRSQVLAETNGHAPPG